MQLYHKHVHTRDVRSGQPRQPIPEPHYTLYFLHFFSSTVINAHFLGLWQAAAAAARLQHMLTAMQYTQKTKWQSHQWDYLSQRPIQSCPTSPLSIGLSVLPSSREKKRFTKWCEKSNEFEINDGKNYEMNISFLSFHKYLHHHYWW